MWALGLDDYARYVSLTHSSLFLLFRKMANVLYLSDPRTLLALGQFGDVSWVHPSVISAHVQGETLKYRAGMSVAYHLQRRHEISICPNLGNVDRGLYISV